MAEDRDGELTVKHGQLSYLQLPALDVAESAKFYAEVFRWEFVPEYPGASTPQVDSSGLSILTTPRRQAVARLCGYSWRTSTRR